MPEAALRAALAGARGGPAPRSAGQARSDGRRLGLRHHPGTATSADAGGDPGRARGDRPSRGRHRARRHRHPSPEHPRGAALDARTTGDGVLPGGRSRGARPQLAGGPGHGRGRAGPARPGWVSADLRITTGFVEPHFFAGFSGGPKMVAPGLAGMDTTLELHNARRIGDPRATWGVCEGNPVHDAVRAIAAATGVGFSLDVLLDREQRITRAFGGPVLEMHAPSAAVARQEAMRAVPDRFDIVVTSNSGYPLDQNLYQAIKGISAAAEIVRDGGTIICAAECRDGLPDHGNYAQLLASRRHARRSCWRPSTPPRDHPRPVAGPGPGTHPGAGEGAGPRRRTGRLAARRRRTSNRWPTSVPSSHSWSATGRARPSASSPRDPRRSRTSPSAAGSPAAGPRSRAASIPRAAARCQGRRQGPRRTPAHRCPRTARRTPRPAPVRP